MLLSGAESLSQCQTFRQMVPPFASSTQQSEAWFDLLILNKYESTSPPPLFAAAAPNFSSLFFSFKHQTRNIIISFIIVNY